MNLLSLSSILTALTAQLDLALPVAVTVPAIAPSVSSGLNVKDFGATGDATADDSSALQKAINSAREQQTSLFFPTGIYRITHWLDWGNWIGISVYGACVPGSMCVAGINTSIILADANVTGGAVHDFTGSAFGKVQGLSFSGGGAATQVLMGPTAVEDFGSNLVFERCTFEQTSGTLYAATFTSHMGEEQMWRNCKFNSAGPRPGLLITWRTTHWNITAPSGRALTSRVSVMRLHIQGGDFRGGSSGLITLDMPGQKNAGSDLTVSRTSFAGSDNVLHAIELHGALRSVHITGIRLESRTNPVSQLSGRLISLVEQSTLAHFLVSDYEDGHAFFDVIAGGGSLELGDIVGHGKISVTGNITDVNVRTIGQAVVSAQHILRSTVRASGLIVHASTIELDDGKGGWLVHQANPPGLFGCWWQVPDGGVFEASLGGQHVLFHATKSAFGEDFPSPVNLTEISRVRADTACNIGLSEGIVSAACAAPVYDMFTVRRLTHNPSSSTWYNTEVLEPTSFLM